MKVFIGHYIRPECNRINVFCTRKSGHYIRMTTINVATISAVHCTKLAPKFLTLINYDVGFIIVNISRVQWPVS